ncbi:MAG: M20/M25/M40 family metallo-hydrolase [Planctomycetes bacterium]|nr:M20/M25/M40 family metallo-hydrolase [Planctomycetota bacterium]
MILLLHAALLASLAACASLPAAGENAVRPLASGTRMMEYAAALAADDMQGRKSGTEGYQRAAEWVAARFAEWGLVPAGEDGSYFQQVEVEGYEWHDGRPELSVAGRAFLLDDEDFALRAGSTPGVTVEAEVVFAGYGIAAPDKGLDEYAGLDAAGKIVLVLAGSPHDALETREWPARRGERREAQAEDEWREHATLRAKARAAYDKGAAALLVYDPAASAERGGRARRPWREEENAFAPERGFLCFSIAERVFRQILRTDPQESPRGFTRRLEESRREIEAKQARSRATGVLARLKGYDQTITYGKEQGNNRAPNVLARIPGVDPALQNEYVFVGAHLDHVGMSDGYVYNGADDNVSGVTVVLEVGRALKESGFQPLRTVILACWCGEELGLLGSNYYTSHPCDGVSMDRVVACFNPDMVGRGEKLAAEGALNFPSIWEVIQRGQDPELMKLVAPSEGGPGGSDHSGFIVQGIEALMLIGEGGADHPDYHQPEDDAARLDPQMLQRTAQFVTQGVMNLASETQEPLLLADRKRIYDALRVKISNFNPDLKDSAWERLTIDAANKEALREQILARAVEIIEAPPVEPGAEAGERPARAARPEPAVARGIADLRVFEGDAQLLDKASRCFGFGRVDVRGDDGFLVREGRLTDAGRAALGVLEGRGIAVHLESPGAALLDDFLQAAQKPFLVTGKFDVDESRADLVVEKSVLLGVDFDPKQVEDFIARLEDLKERVGRRELLVAWLTSVEGLEDARKPLYLGLLGKGWASREICGTRRNWGGIAGGNMRAIGAEQPGRRWR